MCKRTYKTAGRFPNRVCQMHAYVKVMYWLTIFVVLYGCKNVMKVYYYYNYNNYYYSFVSCHRLFLPGTSPLELWSPPLEFQVSDCSTSRITCDVPCPAVFCSVSVDCCFGVAFTFFFKSFVTIPMPPIIALQSYIFCSTLVVSLYVTLVIRSVFLEVFTAVIYTHLYSLAFHLCRCVNIYSDWLREQFCILSFVFCTYFQQ